MQIGDRIDEFDDDDDDDDDDEDMEKIEAVQGKLKREERKQIAKLSHDLEVLEKDLEKEEVLGDALKVRLPDAYNKFFALYLFGPSGLKDYGSTMLSCKI